MAIKLPITKEHYGKYVALSRNDDCRILATSSDLAELCKQARALGCEEPAIVYVPDPNILQIYSANASQPCGTCGGSKEVTKEHTGLAVSGGGKMTESPYKWTEPCPDCRGGELASEMLALFDDLHRSMYQNEGKTPYSEGHRDGIQSAAWRIEKLLPKATQAAARIKEMERGFRVAMKWLATGIAQEALQYEDEFEQEYVHLKTGLAALGEEGKDDN